jgi:hypothetical protein
MGGLLAAEAATDPSNAPGDYPETLPRRIVGMVAFDCPYLGMHPRVVISGIASLFPKDGGTVKSERELNPEVNIVDGDVTDNWEAFQEKENSTIQSFWSTTCIDCALSKKRVGSSFLGCGSAGFALFPVYIYSGPHEKSDRYNKIILVSDLPYINLLC